MPQLEVSTFVPQLVWLAITFCLLYVLMARIGLPRVGGIIEARRRRIDDDLDRAAQLKSEAETVMAAYQQTLATARAEAQAAVKETTDRLAAEAAERQRQLSQTLAEQTAAAERQIVAAKQRALSEMHDIAIEVGRSITEKVSGSAPDTSSLAAAVDRAMAERAS
jgi:F-type H+-transporting ATPase subunit b